ncbi:MAG TPA: transglycosylase SLT domain-containing protein [Gemmatimonadaceae bacterium]|nr:transglycosylase SLT domain-containing protein [Gemmatimonadaceae bacterium]
MLDPTSMTSGIRHPGTSMAEPSGAERRTRHDRRAAGSAGRRARNPAWIARKRALVRTARDVGLVFVLLATILVVLHHVNPIFAGRPSVAQSLAERVPGAGALLPAPAPPADTGKLAALTNSPKFQQDRAAFAADLVRTGRMSQDRADSVAYYAVREAYERGIPPAVIFGVMLTENALFVSNAMSNVGAVGLMQVYPKIWLKELGDQFGTDLASDSTNLKYGIYILSQYIKPKQGESKVTPSDVNRGLLRYNGCVRGTNTPHCHSYPSKVKNYVERQGESLCGDKSFYECIARPFVAGLLGKHP